MKLHELTALLAEADTTAQQIEALGQRLVRMPPSWDWESLAAVCQHCDLLLVPLGRSITVQRIVITVGRPMPVSYDLTHAHLADTHGHPVCLQCIDTDTPCPDHQAYLCDTPEPQPCTVCDKEPALPGQDFCLGCRAAEPEWDKDTYLGL